MGKSVNITIDRKRICQGCQGTGSSVPNAKTTCDECHGQGVKIHIQRIAPGFAQQMRARCDKCHGAGEFIPEDMKCKDCDGKTIVGDKKQLAVNIEKGTKHEQQITFPGEGHQIPKTKAGDVVFLIHSEQHPVFTRKGNDLKMHMTISLAEAIGSDPVFFCHLDNRVVSVSRPQNLLIKPGDVMVVRGEGMPKLENSFFKGDLYIDFSVKFPEFLAKELRDELIAKLAPFCETSATNLDRAKAEQKEKKESSQEDGDDKKEDGDDKKEETGDDKKEEAGEMKDEESTENGARDGIWECEMLPATAQFGQKQGGHKQAYDEEGEEGEEGEGEGGQRVGCQHM
jgi:DnaJ-class molecular chaperone